MTRWRVKYSARTKTWWEACHVEFLDAEDAAEVKAIIDGRSTPERSIEVWAITPATEEMEARYKGWVNRCEEWKRLAKTCSAKRSMMTRGPG